MIVEQLEYTESSRHETINQDASGPTVPCDLCGNPAEIANRGCAICLRCPARGGRKHVFAPTATEPGAELAAEPEPVEARTVVSEQPGADPFDALDFETDEQPDEPTAATEPAPPLEPEVTETTAGTEQEQASEPGETPAGEAKSDEPSSPEDQSAPPPLEPLWSTLGADVVNQSLVMPPGYLFREATTEAGRQRKELTLCFQVPAQTKLCSKCAKEYAARFKKCSVCDLDLPDAPLQQVPICRLPLWVGALFSHSTGELYEMATVGRAFLMPQGLIHDLGRLATTVQNAGLPLIPGMAKPLAHYLDQFTHTNRLTLPRRVARSATGWTENRRAFMYGEHCIGGQDAWYQPTAEVDVRAVQALRSAGSADLWREVATAFISESPVAALALAIAVASPMLQLFGWRVPGLILPGLGGVGKTTIARLGASAFGATGDGASNQAGGLVGRGDGTLLSLSLQFALLPDLPHFADEFRIDPTHHVTRGALANALHGLIDGQPRAAARRDGRGIRAGNVSLGGVLICSETDPEEFLVKGGVKRRFMVARPPYSTGSEPIGRFNPILGANYGHAGRRLVERLVASTATKRATWTRYHAQQTAVLLAGLTDGQKADETTRTWAAQMATCLGAVLLATELCPELFPSAERWRAQVLAAWDGMRVDPAGSDAADVDPALAAYRRLVATVAGYRSRFQPTTARAQSLVALAPGRCEAPLYGVAQAPLLGKVVEAHHEGEPDERLRVVDLLQSEAVRILAEGGHSMRTMAPTWIVRGWLLAGKDHTGRVPSWVGGVRQWAYRVVLPAAEGEPEPACEQESDDVETEPQHQESLRWS